MYTKIDKKDRLITHGSIKCALSVPIIVVLSMLGSEFVAADDYEPSARLIATDGAALDSLGKESELSGNTMIVGAAQHNHAGSGLNSGGAYIFSADAGGVWSERAELRPTPAAAAGDLFGFSVDISGDTAIVGATNSTEGGVLDSGAAYVFVRNMSGAWIQQGKLLPDVNAGQRFGISVAVSGDIAMVGSAHTVNFAGQGVVYVFERNMGGSWSQTQTLVSGDPSSNAQFGSRIRISGDLAIIGEKDNPRLAPQAGAAYIFARQASGSWQQEIQLLAQDTPDAARNRDQFGEAVAISGNVAVIGAHVHNDPIAGDDAGAAYVFTGDGAGAWSRQKLDLPPTVVAGDQFGQSVGISGNTIFITTHAQNNGLVAGSAHRYEPDGGGTWVVQQKILPDPGSVHTRATFFGASISADNLQVVVGTSGDINENGHGAGAAYVFKVANTPAGMGVAVDPTTVDDDGNVVDDSSVSMIFDDVMTSGSTTVVVTDTGPPPTAGFQLGTPTTYYEITTDASFSGSVEVCIDYTGQSYDGSQQEPNLTLDHFENGNWVNITTSLDIVNNIICGSTTSFSFFAILEPSDPVILIAILISSVVEFDLQEGISISLDTKLQAAQNALEDAIANNNIAAINALVAFINAVEAQSGHLISVADADSMIAQAQLIIDQLAN